MGSFIVFEGIDRSGKSTTIIKLKEELEKLTDKNIVLTFEPGGTPIGNEIRQLLKNTECHCSDLTEAYLFAASRAEHINLINKWLEKDYIILCDRFIYSSYIYQGGYKNLSIDVVKGINKYAINNLIKQPDMIFVFHIDYKNYINRRSKEKLDRIEKNNEFFFNTIETLYSNEIKGKNVYHLSGLEDNTNTIINKIKERKML